MCYFSLHQYSSSSFYLRVRPLLRHFPDIRPMLGSPCCCLLGFQDIWLLDWGSLSALTSLSLLNYSVLTISSCYHFLLDFVQGPTPRCVHLLWKYGPMQLLFIEPYGGSSTDWWCKLVSTFTEIGTDFISGSYVNKAIVLSWASANSPHSSNSSWIMCTIQNWTLRIINWLYTSVQTVIQLSMPLCTNEIC